MQETSELNNPPLLPKGIARAVEGKPAVLLGGFCPHCQRRYFPRPGYCPQCLAEPQECDIAGEGVIYSYTVVRTKPPLGLPQPYAVAYLDLAESGLRIFGLLDPEAVDQLAIGASVRLKVGLLGKSPTGEPCLRPYFALSSGEVADG